MHPLYDSEQSKTMSYYAFLLLQARNRLCGLLGTPLFERGMLYVDNFIVLDAVQ